MDVKREFLPFLGLPLLFLLLLFAAPLNAIAEDVTCGPWRVDFLYNATWTGSSHSTIGRYLTSDYTMGSNSSYIRDGWFCMTGDAPLASGFNESLAVYSDNVYVPAKTRLTWSSPGMPLMIRSSLGNFFQGTNPSWSIGIKYLGSSSFTWYSSSKTYIDLSKDVIGVAFRTTTYYSINTTGVDYYYGVSSLPELSYSTGNLVTEIRNQTEELKDTSGSSTSASDVLDAYSEESFNTKLGAVSQVADIGSQLFQAFTTSQGGNGIQFPGYSIDLPIYGTLSVPASNIDIWGNFPAAETPVKTAVTFSMVMAWIHGLYRWYEKLVGQSSEVVVDKE